MRAALLAGALLLTACGGGDASPSTPSAAPSAPSAPPSASGSAPAPLATPSLPVVVVTVGGTPVQAEVADTDQTRSDGLRGRRSVPPGTGMVFRFPEARPVGFTMSGVTYPLVAVFALEGEVVAVEQMVPCAGTIAACPVYGPDGPVDTVLEAAPETLPDVAVGDALVDG